MADTGGLLLPATLAQKLGLKTLFNQAVDLGGAPGRGNVGVKALVLRWTPIPGQVC